MHNINTKDVEGNTIRSNLEHCNYIYDGSKFKPNCVLYEAI